MRRTSARLGLEEVDELRGSGVPLDRPPIHVLALPAPCLDAAGQTLVRSVIEAELPAQTGLPLVLDRAGSAGRVPGAGRPRRNRRRGPAARGLGRTLCPRPRRPGGRAARGLQAGHGARIRHPSEERGETVPDATIEPEDRRRSRVPARRNRDHYGKLMDVLHFARSSSGYGLSKQRPFNRAVLGSGFVKGSGSRDHHARRPPAASSSTSASADRWGGDWRSSSPPDVPLRAGDARRPPWLAPGGLRREEPRPSAPMIQCCYQGCQTDQHGPRWSVTPTAGVAIHCEAGTVVESFCHRGSWPAPARRSPTRLWKTAQHEAQGRRRARRAVRALAVRRPRPGRPVPDARERDRRPARRHPDRRQLHARC